jgi:dynein heavy chain
MVLLESHELGHSVYVTSYETELKKIFEEKVCAKLAKVFHHILDLSVEFTTTNCHFPCPGNGAFVVNHMIRIIECYMVAFKPKHHDSEEEIKIPNDIEDKLINCLIYATIWGIGGALDEFTSNKFDIFLQDMINGEDVREKYNVDMGPDGAENYPAMKIPNKIGEMKSLYDMYFDMDEMRWTHWLQTVPKYVVDKDSSYLQLSIPTIDSIRMVGISKMLLLNSKHVLAVGPTGTGKSV